MTLDPDLDQARRFLAMHRRGGARLQLSDRDRRSEDQGELPHRAGRQAQGPARPDHQPAARQPRRRWRPGTTNGAAVWVMINEGDGKGRTEAERHPRARRVRRPGRRAARPGDALRARAARRGRELAGQVPRLLARGRLAARSVRGCAAPHRHDVQRRFDLRSAAGDAAAGADPRQGPRQRRSWCGSCIRPSACPIRRQTSCACSRRSRTASRRRRATGAPICPTRSPPDRLEALKAAHPLLFDARRYKSTSERDFALACLACKLGWPQEDAVALIRAVQDGAKARSRGLPVAHRPGRLCQGRRRHRGRCGPAGAAGRAGDRRSGRGVRGVRDRLPRRAPGARSRRL